MSEKKNKQQVINNIQELNIEIDYDKLAEAIVRSTKKAQALEEIEARKKKICKSFYVFVFAWGIIAICVFILGILFSIFESPIKGGIFILFATIPALVIYSQYLIQKYYKIQEAFGIYSLIVSIASLLVAFISVYNGVG